MDGWEIVVRGHEVRTNALNSMTIYPLLVKMIHESQKHKSPGGSTTDVRASQQS